MDDGPDTPNTKRLPDGLAELGPRTLAVTHRSIVGAAGALRDVAEVMREVYGGELEPVALPSSA